MSSPEIWGSTFWKTLNLVVINYPPNPTNQDINDYKNFFISFGKVLPCKLCSVNYENHLNLNDLENGLKNKKNLIDFLINLHNKVNKSTNKRILSYEEAYEKIHNSLKPEFNKYHLILLSIGSIFLIYIFLNLKKFKKYF